MSLVSNAFAGPPVAIAQTSAKNSNVLCRTRPPLGKEVPDLIQIGLNARFDH